MNPPDTYNIIEIQCMHSSDSARLFVDRMDYEQLREQVEKLTRERDEAKSVADYWLTKYEAEHSQLAALAEQNEKMRGSLIAISIAWSSNDVYSPHFFQEAFSIPDLASPVLNRIRAEGMREGAIVCDEAVAKWEGPWKNAANTLGGAIRARADELEKSQ